VAIICAIGVTLKSISRTDRGIADARHRHYTCDPTVCGISDLRYSSGPVAVLEILEELMIVTYAGHIGEYDLKAIVSAHFKRKLGHSTRIRGAYWDKEKEVLFVLWDTPETRNRKVITK